MRIKVSGLAVVLAALTSAHCHHDSDDNDGGGHQAPAAANVIPADFKNSTDEAGFKSKLPHTSEIMDASTQGLSLHNSSTPSKKFNLASAMLSGVAKRVNMPQLAKVDGTPAPKQGDDQNSAEGEDVLKRVQDLKAGSDCTSLMVELSSSYESVAQQYTDSVNKIAEIDFSQTKGVTKATPDKATEAFAYNIALTSDDVQNQQGAKSTDSSDGVKIDGKWTLNGRFAGGANDNAVALRANGTLTATSDKSGNGTISSDFDSYADIPAKSLSFGIGIAMTVNGKDQDGKAHAANGQAKMTATLVGGDKPAQTLSISGNATVDQKASSADLRVKLERPSTDAMTLTLAGKTDKGSIDQKVDMAITNDGYNDTCKVTQVSTTNQAH